MEYVYGTAEIDGVMRENLKVIGGPKLEEGGVPDHGSGVRRQHDHRPVPH